MLRRGCSPLAGKEKEPTQWSAPSPYSLEYLAAELRPDDYASFCQSALFAASGAGDSAWASIVALAGAWMPGR